MCGCGSVSTCENGMDKVFAVRSWEGSRVLSREEWALNPTRFPAR